MNNNMPYKLLTYEEAITLPSVKEALLKAGIDMNNPDHVEMFTRLFMRQANYNRSRVPEDNDFYEVAEYKKKDFAYYNS